MIEDFIDELWATLNSTESEASRIDQMKDLLQEWADTHEHDLPEVEFDLDD